MVEGKQHGGGIGLGRAGQLAAADLIGDQTADRQIGRPIRQIGQRTGDRFQRPDPAQISQSGKQRHPPLGPAQGCAQLLERHVFQRLHLGGQHGFGRLGQRGAQPVALSPHQPAQIGAASGSALDQPAQLGRQIGKGAGGVLAGLAVKGDGLTGKAGGEIGVHEPLVALARAQVNGVCIH